jgi:hypothetical protein
MHHTHRKGNVVPTARLQSDCITARNCLAYLDSCITKAFERFEHVTIDNAHRCGGQGIHAAPERMHPVVGIAVASPPASPNVVIIVFVHVIKALRATVRLPVVAVLNCKQGTSVPSTQSARYSLHSCACISHSRALTCSTATAGGCPHTTPALSRYPVVVPAVVQRGHASVITFRPRSCHSSHTCFRCLVRHGCNRTWGRNTSCASLANASY